MQEGSNHSLVEANPQSKRVSDASSLIASSVPEETPEQRRSQQPRRVSFNLDTEIIPTTSPLQDLADWTTAWYEARDLCQFRDTAKKLCQQVRKKIPVSRGELRLATDDIESRGIEHRICFERQRRRYLCSRVILKTQSKFKDDPERLAALYQRCTSYASELATEEAARDFAKAYEEQGNDSQPTRKRSLTMTVVGGGSNNIFESNERRVRARSCHQA